MTSRLTDAVVVSKDTSGDVAAGTRAEEVTLERAEVTRVGRATATECGLSFREAKTGEYVSGS